MKICEIIHHSNSGDILDSIVNLSLSQSIYELYAQVLRASNNYEIPPYELTSGKYQFGLQQIKDKVLVDFPEKSTARQMVEELLLYFDWFE